MRLFRRYVSRECPPEVIDGLEALYSEYPDCRRVIDGTYIFYALIGRDKAKLTMDWVEKCRVACEEHRKLQVFLNSIADGSAFVENETS